MLEIVRIPVLSDNYVWLVHEPASAATMVVDPAVADPVLAAAAARCAAWNVRANLSHIEDGPGKDELRADVESQINSLDLQARELELQINTM